MKRIAMCLALAAGLIAEGTPVSGEGTAAELFDATVLHRVDINLHTADWAKLKQNFQTNEYYPADLTFNGETVYNTGIRSRGVASRSGIKPGLRVDFNHYNDDQMFLGLRSLVLDNLTQDASGVHETVAMWLFNKMRIPAPRESHTRLYVNGDYAGVYAIIEPIDKEFLARVFGSNGDDVLNDGYLFEFEKAGVWNFGYLGSDLTPYKTYFQAKTHESKPDEDKYRLIETIVRLANEKPPSELAEALGPYLDLKGLVRYLAVQNFIAEQDGFIGEFGMNNFYLYRLEHAEQHVVIAWDDDLTFIATDFGLETRFDVNPLVSKLMQIPEYKGVYLAALLEAAEVSDAREERAPIGALEAEIRRQIGLIADAMFEDQLRPWGDSEVTTHFDLMRQFAPFRIRFVGCEVARLSGGPAC